MRILITGSNGLLGQKLVGLITKSDKHDLIATARGENRLKSVNPELYTFIAMDVIDKDSVFAVMEETKPDVVIHTAAMTHVDVCEQNREDCWELNVESVKTLVDACKKTGAYLVHVSTDFIFDGTEGPLSEDAQPNPVNYYGDSKLAAEKVIEDSGIAASIARTVLVYGIAEDMSRSNIILWVKGSLESGKEIHVVNDQWRTPTLAEDLAMGCLLLAEQQVEGVFNISGKDFLTPFEMAQKTAQFFQLDTSILNETDGSRFTQPAKRPPRTGFIIDKARSVLGYEPHSFEEGLAVLKSQLTA